MVDFLLSIVGLASLGGAIFEFYKFVTDPNPGGGHLNGWIALGLAGVGLYLAFRGPAISRPRELPAT